MVSLNINNEGFGAESTPISRTTHSTTETVTSVKTDLSKISDEQLVAQCKKELPICTQSYEEIVRRYEGIVFNYCQKFLGSRLDAEEICQDTFLKVFQKIHQFEGRSSFKTWLFRIATNMCLGCRGSLAKRRDRQALFEDEVNTQTSARLADIGTEDLAEKLNQAMSRLDEKKREIIILKFVTGLQIEEISTILSLNLSATKMRLYRARDELKEAYTQLSSHTELAA